MIDVEHNRSLLGESLKAKMARLDDFTPIDNSLRRAVLRANRGIAFRPNHRLSHFIVENGRVELGSYAPGYFKLLNLNGQVLGEICAAWVVKGSLRG